MSCEALTDGIRVCVETEFLPERSDARHGRYVFAYTIQIINESDQTVQLRRRHWHILHGSGRREEVEGPGVVGEQPVLEPGTGFEYTSGCVLDAPHGTMEGSYQMERGDGSEFRIRIPAFSLATPHALN